MSIYSLKMRASKHNGTVQEHVSGAEKILEEKELPMQMSALLHRALHHAKGQADFVNLKVEEITPDELAYIPALPVSTCEVDDYHAGRAQIIRTLETLGISEERAAQILALFSETYSMRGAMLLDVDTLERLEPDHERGIRATYMDAEHSHSRSAADCKNHFQEAIVLASKVLAAPHIIAEICMSDDPDYVTGYVATHEQGYVRITQLKPMGCEDGGRIFLYRGPREDVGECIHYLQEQRVLVQNAPRSPLPEKNDFAPWQAYADILADKKAKHLYRTTSVIDSAQSAHIRANGKDMLLLASNAYLGLIDHPDVIHAAQEAGKTYGTGSGGSRLTTGTLPLHEKLERNLARFKGTEAAILFNTGYMANVGIISAMGIKGSYIFSDAKNHASIIDGCRLSHAQTIIYKHNDMADLEAKLAAYCPCQGLIVTDAVFSMDGDIAPLPEIMALAKKYHVLTMVDEAHSTGVIGKTGRGICEHFGLTQDTKPDILMGTMSKALAAEGGYACGSRLLIDYLRNTARSYIFSTSLSPMVLAAADKALELLEAHPEMAAQLQENTRVFCQALQSHGIDVHSDTAIIPIVLHDEELALQAANALKSRSIYISAIRYPTVPKGEAMLRAALMATHTPEELVKVAKVIADTIHELQGNTLSTAKAVRF